VISEHMRFDEFLPGFITDGRRTRVELLNLVIIHIIQHHLSHIGRL